MIYEIILLNKFINCWFLSRELRLVESLENVCERILEYNIHKERTDSTRFAKGMSQTFTTLHNLV